MTPSNELLKRLEEFANRFSEERLRSYIERIRAGRQLPVAPKEINDSIWGTIKLSRFEVVIIDCPLLQRLRLVRQLGVVHWIYPGATHSRFEHTLGVLHQAQQLINAINQSAEGPTTQAPIDPNKAALVRFCAILHDIGHGVYSHVSEHALSRHTEMRLALQAFKEMHRLESVQLSEVLAYYLIGSPAFQDLLILTLDKLGQPIRLKDGSDANAREITEAARKAIIGHHIDEAIPLLHEIITGPFDADKLDYYSRDARHAGVPSVLDISRLIQKITAKQVTAADLPQNIASAISNRLQHHWLFGLKSSGASILDELHLTRVLLYAKVYRHKKVQAIEAMVDGLFDALVAENSVEMINLINLVCELADDQLLVTSAEDIIHRIGADSNPNLLAFVGDMIIRLRERNLYVTALALRPRYEADPWQDDPDQKRGLSQLHQICSNSQKVLVLRGKLINEVQSIFGMVPDLETGFDINLVPFSIVISTKGLPSSGTVIDRALVLEGDKFVRGRDLDRINRSAWADANQFDQPTSLIFSPREIAAAVYVAAERLLSREYGIILPHTAIIQSKQDAEEIDQLKQLLETTGWYHAVPLALRPLPNRLRMQDIGSRIGAIAAKLAKVDEPPAPQAAPRRAASMEDRVIDWLSQFRDDAAIEEAIVALENFRVLERSDTLETLKAFLEMHPEFRGAVICPLGELKDSGAIQAYLSQDAAGLFLGPLTVAEAVDQGGARPVVFFDDFIGSGAQACDILGNWFDDAELKQDELGESRLPFGQKDRDFLKSRKVAFVFVAGWDAGADKLKRALSKLGLDAVVCVHLGEAEVPYAHSDASADETLDHSPFLRKANEIGQELLASNGKSEAKQRDRALGYGNKAMLLSSRWNVPTQTLSCIWMDGNYQGISWQPLLRRRPKQ